MNTALRTVALAFALLPNVATAQEAAKSVVKNEDVRFRTADGLTIAATYWPPATGTPEPAPVVVALPMYRQTRASWAPLAAPITERGMGLLALDLRGHGDSARQGKDDLGRRVEDRDASLFNSMHLDVEAAIAWLAKEKKTPKGAIGLIGASVGCSVAIDATVRNPSAVAAVVCLTPGKDYLHVPTMEHIEQWPPGKPIPILLVASDEESQGGADPIAARLDGKGAELKIVAPSRPIQPAEPMALHGTNMFGKVADIETSVADWLAYHVAFRRLELGGGLRVRIGSTGSTLYVGIESADGGQSRMEGVVLRIGRGPVTDPWSKSETIEIGKRLDQATPDVPTRRRTKLSREKLGVAAGQTFAVSLSSDGKTYFPEAGAPPLLVTLQ